jgi:hypothetical protein
MKSQAGPGFFAGLLRSVHAMRTFFRDHWKAIVAIVLLVLLALLTMNPSAAVPAPALAECLRAHMAAIAPNEHGTDAPAEPEAVARYVGTTLGMEGYQVRRQDYRTSGHKVRNIEVSVANVAPRAKPARIFIIGANDNGGGTAAVLELARLLKDMRPSQGTEVKFVFFVHRANEYPGNFIAFVGTLESSRLVQDALSAFRNVSGFPARGVAAPAYVQGVTLSDHRPYRRSGYPAVVITDTGFVRYPYYRMNDRAADPPDTIDYQDTARVVQGLAHTIRALACAART